jgi:hypothetical protein
MFKFFASVWRSNWKNKVMLIGGALILLASAVLIPYAVITRHGDIGFLKASNGKPLQWEKGDFPITCMAHSSVEPKHLAVYEKARSEINARVGRELLGFCSPWMLTKPFPTRPMRATVLLHIGRAPQKAADGVIVDTPWTAHPGGVTRLWGRTERAERIYGSMVWIDPTYGENFAVWLHELGHVLGLDHDRLRDSIMWPKIQERAGKLSGKDAEALADAYK